jgi:hypothetical protein
MFIALIWLAVIYCGARAIVDLRRRRYGWAAAGLLAAAIVASSAVPAQRKSVTIPAAG